MNTENQFKWIDFYTNFAAKLLEFKNDRQSLIQKLRKTYSDIGIKFPKLEKDSEPKDVDPFTIFGLFNNEFSDEKRKTVIKGLIREFSVNAEAPDDFSGIPVMVFNSAFYAFTDRGENDIDTLWDVFAFALDFSQNRSNFCEAYNKARDQRGVSWNITMGLYWIRPDLFINLDTKNRKFLSTPDNISADIASEITALKTAPFAEKYLDLCERVAAELKSEKYEYKTFPELSYTAWIRSTENNKTEKSSAAFLRWFKPIIQALRDLGGEASPDETRSKIIENEKLSEEDLLETRGKTQVNKFGNEVFFARHYLMKSGYIDGSTRGIWKLTDNGKTVDMTDELAAKIHRDVQKLKKLEKEASGSALGDEDVSTVRYWLYAPGRNAVMWEEFYEQGIMGIGWNELGDLNVYTSKNEIRDKLCEINNDDTTHMNSVCAVWQFAHEMKKGDVIFIKRGKSEILGRGIVESDYEYDNEKDYPNIRRVKWTHKIEQQIDKVFPVKTLTDITDYTDFTESIKALFEDDDPSDIDDSENSISHSKYTKEDFLNEVYIDSEMYDDIREVLSYKKNIIFQGAPGVGKTFLAKRLAYSLMGVKDINRVMMIQFHQSYSYEDFIMGFRPCETGFKLNEGPFYKFCETAKIDNENDYYFIIDEINRGNLSKIFGELFMLIENDKRGEKIRLLYSGDQFSVPKNVYIIGLMNTADRSLAMLDFALRRRFAFFEIKPAFSSNVFNEYRIGLNDPKLDNLIECVKALNEKITEDESLGEGFCIGHSYFCNFNENEPHEKKLTEIVEYELIPILREYWFDEPQKVKEWSEKLRSAIR